MAVSSSINNYYIYSVISNQNIKIQDLTIESIDRYFSDLLENVKNYILEQQFDFVFDLFEEMITSEVELKSNKEPLIFNNMDFNKFLLYQVDSLQCCIIDLLIHEIQTAHLDYLNMLQYNDYFAQEMKKFTLSKFNSFLEKLDFLRSINGTDIDRYIQIITQKIEIFQ